MPQHTHLAGCAAAAGYVCTCEPRRYWRIFLITLGICFIQITGGILSGSLALFSDSVHAASDGVSALISLLVARHVLNYAYSRKRQEAKRRFWMRVSGFLLLGSLVWIGMEAIERYQNPSEVVGSVVMLVAAIGAIGNVWQHRLVPRDHTTTAHMQRLHVEGDLYSSIAVVAAGALIWTTGWMLIDPILTFCIIFFIGKSTLEMMVSGEADHDHLH